MGFIRLSQSNGQMVPCCLSTQAVKQVSRMNQIDQMESNGFHSTKPGQMVMVRINGSHFAICEAFLRFNEANFIQKYKNAKLMKIL